MAEASTKGVAAYQPWDTSPPSQAQIDYIGNVVRKLGEHDWTSLADTTMATHMIDKLNSVRRAAGIAFEQF